MIWKNIPGFEGYQASECGMVRSVDRFTGRRFYRGKVLKRIIDRNTLYCAHSLRVDGKTYTRRVHVLIALTFIGPRPDGFEIDHINGDKSDNSVNNLEYVSSSENSKRAYAIGLVKKKVGGTNSKIKKVDVVFIRYNYAMGMTFSDISKIYPIDQRTVGAIARRESWAGI